MKDKRFIELVNLYVDRQISDEETNELEAEMQSNPRRRSIYRQYCQMHRATTLVYESFRTDDNGEQSPSGAGGGERITRFEPTRRAARRQWPYYASGIAAACVALALVRTDSGHSEAIGMTVAQTEVAPVTLVADVAAPTATSVSPAAMEHREGGLKMHKDKLIAEQDYAAMLAALRSEEQRTLAGRKIQGGSLSLFDDGIFDTHQNSGLGNQRIFRGPQASEPAAEFTAFQFQR